MEVGTCYTLQSTELSEFDFQPNHSLGRLDPHDCRKRSISNIFPCSGIFLWEDSAKPHGSTPFLHIKPCVTALSTATTAQKPLLELSSNLNCESYILNKFLL